ncbi:copper homeostasis periplasmic binding protein CopC [Bordetella sp. N]|uniref:copper homeostasis periplasmic binding protein CopC n=1 Tax=Bordetella sp. N TaxID=1746199 RepID=UPI00070CE61B|nr:copper homeostasis periplasmic binding protein CopC [Bordetella sp. N]ALM82729.1 hypothetical protein ASB57_06960 [Bordetella sp. N]
MSRIFTALAAGLIAVLPHVASAHAHLKQSNPAKDAVVQVALTQVTASFTEGLEPAFSSLSLVDAAGKSVDGSKAAPAPGDDKTLVLPIAKPLPAGSYTAKWHVLSKDGHKTQGEWTFTVKP